MANDNALALVPTSGKKDALATPVEELRGRVDAVRYSQGGFTVGKIKAADGVVQFAPLPERRQFFLRGIPHECKLHPSTGSRHTAKLGAAPLPPPSWLPWKISPP